MKYLLLVLMVLLLVHSSLAQAPNKAQIEQLKQMAERMKGMTPQQIIRQQDSILKIVKKMQGLRDSITTDVLTKTSKTVPNGDQLLIKHHYDTGYTKVTFLYTYTSSTRSTKAASNLYFSCGGSNNKAPKIYEANGHFIVGTSSVGQNADTKVLDTMASRISRGSAYMDATKAQKNIDVARQVSFSTMVVNDNGLKPSVGYSAHGSSECGSTVTDIQGLPTNEGFTFEFDPVTNLSTVGLGANFKVLNIAKSWCPTVSNNSEEYITGMGFKGSTDVTKAKMAGQRKVETDNSETPTYLNVRKSGGGVSISYQRSKNFIDNGGENIIRENLTAFIGDEDKMYEAIIRPVEAGKFRYNRWLPGGPKTDGNNDKKGDDSLQFYIEIRNTKDTTKLYPGSFTVNWILDDVTKYPGFCNNYPKYSDNPIIAPDLKFDSLLVNNGSFDASSITDHTANSKTALGSNAFAHIICMDYGAYGKLKAVVIMDDGSIINAVSPYDKNAEYLTIPLDMNDNKIADAWEKKEGVFEKNYPGNWDEDALPKDLGKPEERGDGYTLLEEYRGFSANKKYFRSSANTMDLMVCDMIGGRSKDGINMYRGVTQVIVHDDFKPEEFGRPTTDPNEGLDHDKCMNFNYSPETHSVDQHGIAIINTTEKINYAEAVSKKNAKGKDLPIGTPKSYKYLKIGPAFDPGPDGWNVTHGNISADPSSVKGDPEGKAKIISDSYSHTVAHEMLHCSNVKHHGDEDMTGVTLIAGRDVPNGTDLNNIQVLPNGLYIILDNKLYGASTGGLVFWEDGTVYSDRLVPPGGFKNLWIGEQGGQHSGFEDCIMRYRAAVGYFTADRKLYILHASAGYNMELAGIYLCTSKTGTGVNDKDFSPRPRYGDATEGDCKHQFCINDKYH